MFNKQQLKETKEIIPLTIDFMREFLFEEYEKSFCLGKGFNKERRTLSKKEGEKRATKFILTARSLKLDPIQALVNSSLWVHARGNVVFSSQLQKELYTRHGHTIEMVEATGTRCKLIGKRRCQGKVIDSHEIVVVRTQNENSLAWEQHTKSMLITKAMLKLIKIFFPEVVGVGFMQDVMQSTLEFDMDNDPTKNDPTKIAEPAQIAEPAKLAEPETTPDNPKVTPIISRNLTPIARPEATERSSKDDLSDAELKDLFVGHEDVLEGLKDVGYAQKVGKTLAIKSTNNAYEEASLVYKERIQEIISTKEILPSRIEARVARIEGRVVGGSHV